MSRRIESKTALLIFAAAVIVPATVALPGTAQANFFDQLFGGGTHSFYEVQQPEPVYTYEASRPVRRHHAVAHSHPRVMADKKSVKPESKDLKQIDLMHDQTLRVGDAVMTQSGIKIFTGSRQHTHDSDDFTLLQNASRINPKERLALAEINAARTGQVLEIKKSKTSAPELVTGRSAVVSSPISKGVMLVEHDGKTIRYVGP